MAYLLIFLIISFLGLCKGIPTRPESRIIGGIDAPEYYAPHMVSLIGGSHHNCGGSIISRSHVLTAAHCLTPWEQPDLNGTLSSLFHGRVGSKNWREGGTIIRFSAHYIHPKYDDVYIKYDVAVLVVTCPLTLSKDVAIICMDFHRVEEDEEAFLTGWGRTGPREVEGGINLAPTPDELQLLYTTVMGYYECSYRFRKLQTDFPGIPHIDAKIEICTFHSVGHGNCHGDSGSALVSVSTECIIGLVSWGKPCARGAPDVYTSISGCEDWLPSILNS